MWDNERSETAPGGNPGRPLTHPLDYGERQAVVKANEPRPETPEQTVAGFKGGLETGGTLTPPEAPAGTDGSHRQRLGSSQPVDGTAERPLGTIWHPKCGKSWTGTRVEHCAVCCETFSGMTAGDMHRKGPGTARRCVRPETVGLVYDEARDLWRRPGTWRPERAALEGEAVGG